MWSFWQIVTSNAIVVLLLAIGVGLVSRFWKNAAALHLLWLIVLLKLFAPPLVITRLPVSFAFLQGTVHAEALDRHAPSTAGQQEHPSAALVADSTLGNRLVASPQADERGPQIERWKRFVAQLDRPLWNVSVVVGAIWLLGAFCVGTAYVIRIRRFARFVAHFEPPSAAIQQMVAKLSQRLGLVRVPDVLMTSRTLPPLVWSIARAPRVILPSRLFARLSGEAQAAILAHELVHVRRRDYLVRLLELVATTLFWWHPVVRWATWQLRELEEQCCDARVLQLFPQQPRTYAAALVDTLEFLSEQPRTFVPLPTAIQSGGSLSRRIRMLTENRRNRLSGLSAALVVGLVSLPFVVGFAADPAANKQPDDKEQKAGRGSITLLEGRVTNEAGAPLADARVRIAIPAAPMQFLVSAADHRLLETKTDAKGDFRLELPGITKPTKISIDAQLAGYRRLTGTIMMRERDPNEYQIAPGGTVRATVTLKPALYFSGIVVDEKGKPIPGVEMWANANATGASGAVERTKSNTDGSFELFNYSPKRFDLVGASCRGTVSFDHPDYIDAEIDDVYTIPDQDRRTLRIVMPTGHSVAGTILDDAGNPVPRAMVKAVRNDGVDRKATMTDAKGQFKLRGLAEGPTTLSVRAIEIKQKIQQPLLMNKDQNDLVVRLQKMLVPPHVKRYTVLGMELADLTPKLKAAYDLPDWWGALILDPGKDSDRLNIGPLAEGYDFWMVGEKRILSVRQFVEQILAEAATQQTKQTSSIRVVYNFSTVDFDGSNTKYLKLTPDDIKQLQVVLAQLNNDAKLPE